MQLKILTIEFGAIIAININCSLDIHQAFEK